MERRTFVIGSVAGATLLAGCTENDPEFESNGDEEGSDDEVEINDELASDDNDTAPSVQMSFTFDSERQNVTLRHDGGSSFSTDTVRLTGSGGTTDNLEEWGNGQVREGASVTVNISVESEGDTLRVIWEGSDGSSNVIARSTVPRGF